VTPSGCGPSRPASGDSRDVTRDPYGTAGGHGHPHTGRPGAAGRDARYAEGEHIRSGRPNHALMVEAARLPPGRALDVGRGEGADAVWLASRGWQVTGLDPSGVALERAREAASVAGVEVEWRVSARDP